MQHTQPNMWRSWERAFEFQTTCLVFDCFCIFWEHDQTEQIQRQHVTGAAMHMQKCFATEMGTKEFESCSVANQPNDTKKTNSFGSGRHRTCTVSSARFHDLTRLPSAMCPTRPSVSSVFLLTILQSLLRHNKQETHRRGSPRAHLYESSWNPSTDSLRGVALRCILCSK